MIKNVVGMGEQSAAGLSDDMGVRLIQVSPQCRAALIGLEEGDVVPWCGEQDAHLVDELLRVSALPAQGQNDNWTSGETNSVYD